MAVGIAIDDGRIGSVNDIVPAGEGTSGYKVRPVTIREVLEGDDVQPLASLIEQATGHRYAEYVSRKMWRRLAAGDAWVELDKPAGVARLDCCFYARQSDWMRVAQLLLADGVYQGSRILPRGWAARMSAPTPRNPEVGFQLRLGTPRDGFYLAGEGKNRLWLVPSLNVAILRLGDEPKDWDEGRIPGLIVAGIEDRPVPAPSTETDLSKLVPHH
jgi:CubicO group peptidase (beta-lactamase class C family)